MTEYEPSQLLTAAWDWSKKWDLPINPSKCNYLTIGREVPLRLSFSPDGSGTSIPACKLVKDLTVQTDNMSSPSAQCTEAANKVRRLIFLIKRSFQDLSKSAFIPLYEALVRPHLQYGKQACSFNLVADINHIERIQRLATGWVTGMRHLHYEERLQRLGLHSLQRQRLRANLFTVFKIFKCLFDIDPNLFSFLPLDGAYEGTPSSYSKVRRRRGTAFSVRVAKYWNTLPASVVSAPSVNVFKKRLEKVWTEGFPHLPHRLNTHPKCFVFIKEVLHFSRFSF